MTTNLGETFRLALAALRSTVGDAKFREIEKTWVQEHQEQTVTTAEFVKFASGKSTKAIDPTDEAVTYHYDFAKPSGAAKITVTYDGQTASFTVKVTADAGNKTGNNPKQQASPVQNGNTSTQPNGVSNPLSKTGASTAPIITLAALTLLTGGVNADTVWLFAAWLRRERSLWGNAVAVLATSMMTVVIASFGTGCRRYAGLVAARFRAMPWRSIGRAFAHCLTGVPGLMCRHGGRRIPRRRRR